MNNRGVLSAVLILLCILLPQPGRLPPAARAAQPLWQTYLPGESVTSIALQDGWVWAGTDDHGLFKIPVDGGAAVSYREFDGLAADGVTAVLADARGHVWAATHRGLSEFDGDRWRTWTTRQGLPSDVVDALALGPEGQVLAGTAEGIAAFSRDRWLPYGQVMPEEGKSPRRVIALAVSPTGELWSGSWYDEVMRMDRQSGWVPVNLDEFENPYRLAQAVAFGPQGELWVGTAGGAHILRGDTWQAYRQRDGNLPGDWVQAVAVDPTGRAWLGTDSGLGLFDRRQWATHRRTSGLAGNDIRAVTIDPRGDAWVATDGGLSRATWEGGDALLTARPAGTGGPPETEPPVRQAWRAVFPGEGAVQAMVSGEDAVYSLTAEGIVRATSAADGSQLWQTSGWLVPQAARCPYDPPQIKGAGMASGPFPEPATSLAVDGDTVIAAVCAGWKDYALDQQILLLDRATGQLRATWPVTAGRLLGVSHGMLIVGDKAGVAAISLQDLREVWRVKSEEEFYPPRLVALVGDVGLIQRYNQNHEAEVGAHSLNDGRVLWSVPLGQDWELGAASDGLAFAVARETGADEARLLALSLDTGNPVWQARLGSLKALYPSSLKLMAHGDSLFVSSKSPLEGLAAYQASTGLKEWTALPDIAVQAVQPVGDTIYVAGSDDRGSRLYALAADDGRTIWTGLSAPSLTLGPVVGDTLYRGSSQAGTDGYDAVLLALRQRR